MEAYTGFAQVYDLFMDNTPYDEWAEFLLKTLRQEGIRDGLILDLCCGTGTMTEILAGHGYDMIGVDSSPEMLAVAMEKGARQAGGSGNGDTGEDACGSRPLYLLQDMREFELYGTVRAVVCVCDSVNYLLEEEELVQTFRLVNNYLDPGGLFIFDFTTVYKYEVVIGDATIAENREESSFIWENYYDREREINEYDVTIFVKDRERNAEGEELFRRFTEFHYQRGYRLSQIREIVKKSGLAWVRALDADTMGEVTEQSERICCVARECGKQQSDGGR